MASSLAESAQENRDSLEPAGHSGTGATERAAGLGAQEQEPSRTAATSNICVCSPNAPISGLRGEVLHRSLHRHLKPPETLRLSARLCWGPRMELTPSHGADAHTSLSVSGRQPSSPSSPHQIPRPRMEAAPLGT